MAEDEPSAPAPGQVRIAVAHVRSNAVMMTVPWPRSSRLAPADLDGAFACLPPGDWQGAPGRAELDRRRPGDVIR
ncbi:hypothetical protein OB08_13095 [Microbacterium sp. HJ5]